MSESAARELYEAITAGDAAKTACILTKEPHLIHDEYFSWMGLAAENDAVPVMEVLLRHGASIDEKGSKCDPPISSAAGSGAFEAVKWLLTAGADVNTVDVERRPLIDAIHSGSQEMVELLLAAGARVDFVWGAVDYSPLTFAESFGPSHSTIAAILREHCGDFVSPQPKRHLDEIAQHVETNLGFTYEQTASEMILSDIPLAVHLFRSSGENRFRLLVTSGMSARAMVTPPGGDGFRFAELMFQLPLDWPLGEGKSAEETYTWPLYWIKKIARYVHEQKTWIGSYSIFVNEDPPEPFSAETQLSCLLALRLPESKPALLNDGRVVIFYTLIPIYAEERALEISHGFGALMKKFDEHNVQSVVDVRRRNAAT